MPPPQQQRALSDQMQMSRVRSAAPDTRGRVTGGAVAGRSRQGSPRPQKRADSTANLRAQASPRGSLEPSRSGGVGRPNSRAARARSTVAAATGSGSSASVSKEEIKRKFKQIDKDGNGALDLSEIKELFSRGKASLISEKEIQALFHMVDKDNSGTVDFDEFVDYIYAAEEHKGPGNPELEVEIPMGGGGLILGGKLGNAVVKVGFVERVKVGWRAVALNDKRLEPMALVRAMKEQGKRGKFSVTFEVDEMTALSMMSTRYLKSNKGPTSLRDQAKQELAELLGSTDLTELAKQSQEQRRAQLADSRIAQLLVDAHAVFEAEVLLGGSSGEAEARHLQLLRALEADDVAGVRECLKGEPPLDLSRRDEDGNMPLHVARSVSAATQLLAHSPETRCMKNADGRNPLNEQVARHPDGLSHDYLEYILDPDEARGRQMLLELDAEGISAAMRMPEVDLRTVAGKIPPWERVASALRKDTHEVIPALREVAGEDWPGLLAFHCFRDILKVGTHTERSWARLGQVWNCLSRMLSGCINRDDAALEASKAMLRATKGPCVAPVDMRLPYRRALEDVMSELHKKSAEILESLYERLQGDAGRWLRRDLKDYLNEALVPDALTSRGLFPRLRMDYRLHVGGGASGEVTPDWAVSAENPPLDLLYDDLRRVGMIGDVRMKDSIYDMLRLSGMGEVATHAQDSGSMWMTRCYGAYLRGVCQGQQQSLKKAFEEAVGDAAQPGKTMFIREEAKKFPRIMEKTLQRIEEINHELKEAGIGLGESAKMMLRTSAAFICDINGVTLVAHSPEELRDFYARLTTAFRLLRTKNTYLAGTASDYRDVKLFLGVATDVGELVVETQLILEEGYREKRWMHLPYVFVRGDLDWPYIRTGPSADSGFREGWNLYHGIKGGMGRADLQQAERVLIVAARQGHFVARGLCHREGWGGYRRDEDKALSCFTAAAQAEQAQAGRREGKCRLGMFHMGAIQNVANCRKRGLDLLTEAAQEGEPEAVYQLAINELRYEDQKALVKAAAQMGHQRAAERMSGYMTSTRKVLSGEW